LDTVAIVAGGIAAVTAGIVITSRWRTAASKRSRMRELDRQLKTRQPPAEHRLEDVERQMAIGFFDGIRKAYANYGEIFASFVVLRTGAAIRMNLETRNAWHTIRPFYRNLALRYLWRGLQQLTLSNNVTICVDCDTARVQTWTAYNSRTFDDGGALEPWANAGSVGTLVSSSPTKSAQSTAHDTAALRARRRRHR
jgi:hypothetical protein